MVISANENGTVTDYTYGLERISASTKNSRTEYVYDGRGSVIGEVTKAGLLSTAKVTTKAYTPFGEQIGEKASGFGWNGEYYSATTGKVYLRARFYEPKQNHFGQKDLLRGSVADGTSLNRYLYCQNDPVNFIDPSGQGKVWDWVKGTFNSAVEEVKSWFAPKQPTVDAVSSAAPVAPKPQTTTYTPSPIPTPTPPPTPVPSPIPTPQPPNPLPDPSPKKTSIPEVSMKNTLASCDVDVQNGWRIVGAGVQADVSAYILDGGAEFVIYMDDYVISQTYPGADFLVATYLYGGPGVSADLSANTAVMKSLFSDETLMRTISSINQSSANPVSASASVFAIVGNENFDSPETYTEWFETYSATVNHIKGYYATSPDAKSIGLGYSTSLISIDTSATYYWLIDTVPYGIPDDGYFDNMEGLVG